MSRKTVEAEVAADDAREGAPDTAPGTASGGSAAPGPEESAAQPAVQPEGGDARPEGAADEERSGGQPEPADTPEQTEQPEQDAVSADDGAEEAGGEAAAAPGWLSQVPYFLVLATMAAGIVIVGAAYFKRGPAIIAGALLLAAAFRAVLPAERIGMLAVRSRWFDIGTAVSLAVGLIVLAWVAPQLTS